ncbi:MAG: zinc ribbon domain-containing protein, partial [Thermoplasmata archaeon]|nr:zinc ribbon domain-containing protein [Thermoplasmata archaeon]
EEGEDDDTVYCPACNGEVDLEASKCPHCGAEFEEVEDDDTVYCPACNGEVDLEASKCPHCGAEFEEGEDDDTVYCPACNGEVDLEVSKCPHCGAEFDESEDFGPLLPSEDLQAGKGTKMHAKPVGRIAAPAADDWEVTTRVPVTRPRDAATEGLSNGTSAVNGVGIINGKGKVNGAHLTNGLGAVNGRDMVNGTGRSRGNFIQHANAPLGRKGIAVLIAIVVVISVFVFISMQQKGSPYEVDGDFSEWDSAATFTMITASGTPDANVLEWSVATYKTQLHMYARVQGQLMASDSAQRLTFFVDADDSDSTGYLLGGVGADFMIEMLGWNETVFTSLAYEYHSTGDQLDWSLWAQTGWTQSSLSGDSIEAMARLPVRLDASSRVILASQDSEGVQCISYPVVMDGGMLIVEQITNPQVASSGILLSSRSEDFLQLRFTCQGEGGTVESIDLELTGVASVGTIVPFDLEPTQMNVIDIAVDSFETLRGQFVSATLEASGISSSFAEVLVTGDDARAYCVSPPAGISIDGAFADWTNRTVADIDEYSIVNPNVDIDQVGAESSTDNSYFYISVFGEICSGVYIPKDCCVYTSTGGGVTAPTRRTAEDFVRIFIDSDESSATGKTMPLGTLTVGADYMIEIGGACGEIRSKSAYAYSSGAWTELDIPVQAAKGSSRMEIGVITASIGDPANMDFVIETSDWRSNQDVAPNESAVDMRSWVVETEAAVDATSMSYQRKVFFDGVNFWSIYSDGSNTVCRYSSDGGETWSSSEDVFTTSGGVFDASLWYDDANQIVYAVGDCSTQTTDVFIQRGEVDPENHNIAWEVSDETLAVSSTSMSGKNTFIGKDAAGYLWILSSQQTQPSPARYNLVAHMSDSTDDISSWSQTGTMLATASDSADLKGSIVSAGSGNEVWAVYNHDSTVGARNYVSGSWGNEENVYTDSGALGFMNTAPASTVVDDNGVVHVVFGDATKDGGDEKPHIRYRYRTSDGWVNPIIYLDDDDDTVGHRYPTVSLDTSTGNVYAFWLQDDDNHIQCKKNFSGSWTSVTLSGGQTSYDKQFLTSIYSAPGEAYICWQWTQNTTGNIEVILDAIPEFGDLFVPVLFVIAVFFVGIRRRRQNHAFDE